VAYDIALKIDPNYLNALDGKGWSLNELGNYSKAIVYLDKALKIDQIISMVWSSKHKHDIILEISLERNIIQTKPSR